VGAQLTLAGLVKRYGEHPAVSGVSLDVGAGEFVTLLGASGSGKTTTLMMVAGFVEPDAGSIRIGGVAVERVPPEKRNLGVVFQSYALFPHMNVAENVGFALRMRHAGRAETQERVGKALALKQNGQTAINELLAETPTRFMLRGSTIKITFEGDGGSIDRLVVEAGGRRQTATRRK